VDWDAPVRSEGRSGLVLSVFVPFERFNDEPGLVGWRVLPRGDDELFLEIAALKLVVEVVLGSFELLLGGRGADKFCDVGLNLGNLLYNFLETVQRDVNLALSCAGSGSQRGMLRLQAKHLPRAVVVEKQSLT